MSAGRQEESTGRRGAGGEGGSRSEGGDGGTNHEFRVGGESEGEDQGKRKGEGGGEVGASAATLFMDVQGGGGQLAAADDEILYAG